MKKGVLFIPILFTIISSGILQGSQCQQQLLSVANSAIAQFKGRLAEEGEAVAKGTTTHAKSAQRQKLLTDAQDTLLKMESELSSLTPSSAEHISKLEEFIEKIDEHYTRILAFLNSKLSELENETNANTKTEELNRMKTSIGILQTFHTNVENALSTCGVTLPQKIETKKAKHAQSKATLSKVASRHKTAAKQ